MRIAYWQNPCRAAGFALFVSLALVGPTAFAQQTTSPAPLIGLTDAQSITGWPAGAKAVSDSGVPGGKAISLPVAPAGAVASVGYNLGDQRDRVTHAAKLRFSYRFDGPAPTTLHLKIIAAPLAGGFQAVYPLLVPAAGTWKTAEIAVQQYEGPWGTDFPPVTTGGRIEFRIGKDDGKAMTLLVGPMEVLTLPAGTAVNTRTASADAGAPAVKISPMVKDNLVAGLGAHPRLLFNAAERDAVRGRATKTSWGREYVADLKKSLDPTLNEPLALPNRGGQWYHWYACPKHGTRLKAKSPTEHVCPTGGEVYTGYPYDDVYLSGIHDRYAGQVRDLGLLYQVTGDKRYATRARAILLAYADKYESYPLHDINGKPNVGGGKVGPQTLDESTWLISMAQGCDAVWDVLSPEDTTALKTKLFFPAAQVIRQHRMSIHNIQCWKNSAVGLVGFLFGDTELLRDAIDNPDRGMQAQLLRGITADGPWYEGAWGYHFYTMMALAPLAEATHNAGLSVYTGALGDAYRRFYTAPLDLALPDGNLPAFNDSGTATALGNPYYEFALARWKDPRFAAALAKSNRKNWQALTAGVDSAEVRAEEPEPSRNFPASGYAVLRAGAGANAATLELKYGPHGGGHGHPDKLNFVFYAGGHLLADDPGTAPYGVPIHAGWYRTTLAHNTLVVNQESQKSATGACLDFKTGEGWSAVLTDAGPIYDGVTFRRAAFLLGTDTVAFLDLATSDQPRDLDFVVHPSGRWEDSLKGNEPMGKEPGYAYLRDAVVIPTKDSVSLKTLLVDKPEPSAFVNLDLTDASPTKLIAATGVGHNTEDRVPILLVRRHTDSTRLGWTLGRTEAKLTLLTVKDASGAALRPADAAIARVTVGARKYLLIANPEGREIVAEGYRGKDKLVVLPL